MAGFLSRCYVSCQDAGHRPGQKNEQMMMNRADVIDGQAPIFIGKIIEEELRRQERTVTWLSRKIHCDRRNIYDIFSRTCIDTGLLYKISLALNCDFFQYFSQSLQSADIKQFTPPPVAILQNSSATSQQSRESGGEDNSIN